MPNVGMGWEGYQHGSDTNTEDVAMHSFRNLRDVLEERWRGVQKFWNVVWKPVNVCRELYEISKPRCIAWGRGPMTCYIEHRLSGRVCLWMWSGMTLEPNAPWCDEPAIQINPLVIKHGLLQNGPFTGDFPIKTSIYLRFCIAMFDSRRVLGAEADSQKVMFQDSALPEFSGTSCLEAPLSPWQHMLLRDRRLPGLRLGISIWGSWIRLKSETTCNEANLRMVLDIDPGSYDLYHLFIHVHIYMYIYIYVHLDSNPWGQSALCHEMVLRLALCF